MLSDLGSADCISYRNPNAALTLTTSHLPSTVVVKVFVSTHRCESLPADKPMRGRLLTFIPRPRPAKSPYTSFGNASLLHRRMASTTVAAPALDPVNAGLSATVDGDSKPTLRYADVSSLTMPLRCSEQMLTICQVDRHQPV